MSAQHGRCWLDKPQMGRTHAPRQCRNCGDVYTPRGPNSQYCERPECGTAKRAYNRREMRRRRGGALELSEEARIRKASAIERPPEIADLWRRRQERWQAILAEARQELARVESRAVFAMNVRA
jgi:predicted  nucleic acid-binding Zn-ribbon protein